ncbi:hypothetical protein CCP3SC1_340023 [Gammaproteobacteria bacterium]
MGFAKRRSATYLWHIPQMDRLFDPKHVSQPDQVETAAEALSRHIEVGTM